MNESVSPPEPTVLIVEDESETADLYADMLADEFDVRTAYSGTEGLEVLDGAVDVVLLDRRMPDLHGDDMLAEIRNRGVDCRVVMVTAVDPDLDIIGLDFDDYLVKPVSDAELRDAVHRMLDRQALDSTIQEAFALASKMATLESRMDVDDLEQSREYAELSNRFAELREAIETIDVDDPLYAELSAVKMQALFDAA